MKKDVEIIEKEKRYSHEALQKIDDARAKFLGVYRRNNNIKTVVIALCMVAIIVALLVLPSVPMDAKLQQALMYIITFVALGGTILYSVLLKRKMDAKLHEYFEFYYSGTNEFAFDQKGFSNIELQHPGKLTLEQFNENKLYLNVVEVGSRGLTKFTFNKTNLTIADCAGNIRDEKRMRPVFVGKTIFGESKYLSEEPIFIYFKAKEKPLPPTNIEGMKVVVDDDALTIYSNNKNWNKFLTTSLLKEVSSLKMTNLLVDTTISLHSGKAFMMLGYDDPLMIVPLQQELDEKPFVEFKKELLEAAKIMEVLNK